jgi:hypothetical protein
VTVREFKGGESVFEIREVFYKRGKVWLWTSTAVNPRGATIDELREDLVMMLAATFKPVMKFSKNGKRLKQKSDDIPRKR